MLVWEAGFGNMLPPSKGNSIWLLTLMGHIRTCPQRWLRNCKMGLKCPEFKFSHIQVWFCHLGQSLVYPEKAHENLVIGMRSWDFGVAWGRAIPSSLFFCGLE